MVKRIDVVDGTSAAWAQIRDAYGVNSIPYVRVYGTGGKFLGEAQTLAGVRVLMGPQARRR